MKLGERLFFALGRGLSSGISDALAREDEQEPATAAGVMRDGRNVITSAPIADRQTLVSWMRSVVEAVDRANAPTTEPAVETLPAPAPTVTPSMPPEDDDVTLPAALDEAPEIVKE